jgi:predicted nucleotidyltransferase component of viral defense system
MSSYAVSSEIEELQALREIIQEVILASLGKFGFFKMATFQGGTCLRIFYGLNRFSEDLDFTLIEPNQEFEWSKYLEQVVKDVAVFGYKMEITDRHASESTVKLGFLKDYAIGKILQLQYAGNTSILGKIKIKLEIDTKPPLGGLNEMKYLDFPYVSQVTVQKPSTLFAGKLHALLCRTYVKGRDWYDFIWCTARKTEVNYHYLTQALRQPGPWKKIDIPIDRTWLHDALHQKIESIDWDTAKKDVRRFIPIYEQSALDLWNADLFIHQLEKL